MMLMMTMRQPSCWSDVEYYQSDPTLADQWKTLHPLWRSPGWNNMWSVIQRKVKVFQAFFTLSISGLFVHKAGLGPLYQPITWKPKTVPAHHMKTENCTSPTLKTENCTSTSLRNWKHESTQSPTFPPLSPTGWPYLKKWCWIFSHSRIGHWRTFPASQALCQGRPWQSGGCSQICSWLEAPWFFI